jgi:hypothetical protein
VLFTTWFASGIVMIYARMPALDRNEYAVRQGPVDLTGARVSPADAARRHGVQPQGVRIGMFAGRPVYRFLTADGWTSVFADDGSRLERMTPDDAVAEARRFAPARSSPRYDSYLAQPDQWTLETRSLLPMHRVVFDDAAGTALYLSDRTAEGEVETTRSGRRWGYAGAVVHWVYFTPLRRHSVLWAQTIIWTSLAGCVMCVSGFAWGLLTPRSRYSGIMQWHHYAGLVFGLATCTWIFSGLLSMDPWGWHPGTSASSSQRRAVAGGPLRLDAFSVPALTRAVASLAPVRGDLELLQFAGEPFVKGNDRLVAIASLARGAFARFPDEQILAAAQVAMPGTPVEDATWLRAYDAYYYDRDRQLPLPVLRVRYADPAHTWLYFDPGHGAIARKEDRLTRVNRWLYHGLHSLDFPWLYDRRPLWDVVMVALSLGGLASAVTSLLPAWRRSGRWRRRLLGRTAGSERLAPHPTEL